MKQIDFSPAKVNSALLHETTAVATSPCSRSTLSPPAAVVPDWGVSLSPSGEHTEQRKRPSPVPSVSNLTTSPAVVDFDALPTLDVTGFCGGVVGTESVVAAVAGTTTAAAAAAAGFPDADSPAYATAFGPTSIVDSLDVRGQSALMWAVRLRQTDILRSLIGHGADVDLRDERGRTALTLAALLEPQCVEVVRELLASERARAGINHQDDNMMSPLMHACSLGSTDAARVLIASGAKAGPRDVNGLTALMLAVTRDQAAIVALLAHEFPAELNAEDSKGWTALHWCAAVGALACGTHLLAARGVDVAAVGRRGETLLHVAADSRSTAFLAMVLEESTAPQRRQLLSRCDQLGRTPLQCAAGADATACVLLLESYAATNDSGAPQDTDGGSDAIDSVGVGFSPLDPVPAQHVTKRRTRDRPPSYQATPRYDDEGDPSILSNRRDSSNRVPNSRKLPLGGSSGSSSDNGSSPYSSNFSPSPAEIAKPEIVEEGPSSGGNMLSSPSRSHGETSAEKRQRSVHEDRSPGKTTKGWETKQPKGESRFKGRGEYMKDRRQAVAKQQADLEALVSNLGKENAQLAQAIASHGAELQALRMQFKARWPSGKLNGATASPCAVV